jgi:pimeloyl-ACP methyl ester carboxylesterase
MMIPSALALQEHYENLTIPVTIIAGDGDKIVFKRSAEQLRAAVHGSHLHIVPGAGHMVHYQATELVAQAIEDVFNA